MATNSISPPYISLELGLGGSAISKALRQVCGLDNRSLKAIYDKYGDAGDVAFEAKKKQSFTVCFKNDIVFRQRKEVDGPLQWTITAPMCAKCVLKWRNS